MRIALITPAGRESKNGNRNTATRWAKFLREFDHRVAVQTEWDGTPADLMLALHARRSHESIAHFASAYPDRGLIVTLTGTDLYRDIRVDPTAQASLRLATRLVVLQSEGLSELSRPLRGKASVIYQSATPSKRAAPLQGCYEVVVVGHLREEKDPLRTALALRCLPMDSRIRVHHLGRALDEQLAAQARAIMRVEPRYRWLGERPHWQVRRYLARAQLMIISSRMEGGANAISEAIAARCPVLASHVPGNIGMLGRDYDGYFALGDERALCGLMRKAETDVRFYRGLKRQCDTRQKLMTPDAERAALKVVIEKTAIEV